MKRMLAGLIMVLACPASDRADAMSCGSPVRIENTRDGQVSVLAKSFYGVSLQRPDRRDFSDVRAAAGAPAAAFTSLYQFVIEPRASSEVTVRTLCPGVAGLAHYVNWRASIDGVEASSGQLDLADGEARIVVR